MANPLSIIVEDAAEKFLLNLAPKQYKQVAARIFALSRDPAPADRRPIQGQPGLWRIDQGEFRILYVVVEPRSMLVVRRVGKRNDDEVYRGL